jgi:hypothetical protein
VIVNQLLSAYGSNSDCAYDIGCAFAKTTENSVLGSSIQHLNLRFMVGSFHGHAHNQLCQLQWHPMYIEGVGNTEGEGCKHVFSASNELAQSTRHATRFHRHQAIEQHFTFWNADKYEALSTYSFILLFFANFVISTIYSESLQRSHSDGLHAE